MEEVKELVFAIVHVAANIIILSALIESGVKHGIKAALKDVAIKVNTYDHR